MRNTYSIGAAVLMVCVSGQAQSTFAQQAALKTFASPAQAAHALAQAVQSHDESALESILGVGKEITSSGDESLDTLEREQFARKYQEMHRLVQEPDGTTVLYIGAENWPFPIPLTSTDGRWSFDARLGADEILYRTIGENETRASELCRTLRNTAPPTDSRDGYRFRAVNGQVATRARATASDGKSISGVTFVAYPVQYRASGVVTFIVTQNGQVYQKDLGPETETLARKIDGRVRAADWNAVASDQR